MRAGLDNHFIVRISWVFGVNGNNFIKTMLRLGKDHRQVNVVADQIGSPTYTADAAPGSSIWPPLIATAPTILPTGGVLLGGAGRGSVPAEGLPAAVKPISTEDYPAKARRPLNSRLDREKLASAGISPMPEWPDALRRYLKELAAEPAEG